MFQNAYEAGPKSDLIYDATHSDTAGIPVSLSVYADRGHVRDAAREDAGAAGLRVMAIDNLSALLTGGPRSLGDVVLVDCPVADAACLAALARLDMRAARSGARILVSTSVEALDSVFACMDASSPQFLVDPSRADRVIALGQVLAGFPSGRLRELSEEDRLMLLRLTEQVGQIASRIDRLAGTPVALKSAPGPAATRVDEHAGHTALRSIRPPLPDPRLVRSIIKHRRLRGRFFEGDLFADPAWDMLLDLTAARAEHARVSVTSLCIAADVPPTTALRWFTQMVEAGLFERQCDDTDRRRAFITLSEKAANAMARYFDEIGAGARLAA
ncbi:helix-turn-helix domain-containing protein [Novosphingobium aquimarinum]|uniref:MarR family transcriptional regulator n=1 Tax=Novosphingobium aquimarinum TaxID=2682494 RepID=UPI001E4158CE|nr:MarR family transcriptional regulator [Novosphingobium aquimarinum]